MGDIRKRKLQESEVASQGLGSKDSTRVPDYVRLIVVTDPLVFLADFSRSLWFKIQFIDFLCCTLLSNPWAQVGGFISLWDMNGKERRLQIPAALDLNRPKRPRTTFSEEQLAGLELEFQQRNFVSEERREILASRLNLSATQIKVWFQNRRTKYRKENKGRNTQLQTYQCNQLPAVSLLSSKLSEINRDERNDQQLPILQNPFMTWSRFPLFNFDKEFHHFEPSNSAVRLGFQKHP